MYINIAQQHHHGLITTYRSLLFISVQERLHAAGDIIFIINDLREFYFFPPRPFLINWRRVFFFVLLYTTEVSRAHSTQRVFSFVFFKVLLRAEIISGAAVFSCFKYRLETKKKFDKIYRQSIFFSSYWHRPLE